ncbi:MAG: TIGR04211 family SH3 domain-containing protein [Gammaproteobacteria bacterium]|nr:TIGR04211 family SH3 domain-containing protein [Gammaproteobacteria bacterium]
MLIFSSNLLAQSVIYVNDILRVGVRAEPVTGSKTVSVVKTGEALEILDSGDSKYYKVRTPAGRVGWVSRTYVSEEKPAFMRLEVVEAELESLKGEVQSVEERFDTVQELNLSLEGELSNIKSEKERLQSELTQIKESALIPEEYEPIAWVIGIILLLLAGYFIGAQRVHNQVRNRFGGLDV